MNTKTWISIALATFLIVSSAIVVRADEQKPAGNAFYAGKYIGLFLTNDIQTPSIFKDEKYRQDMTRKELCELLVDIHCKLNKIDKKDIALPKNPFTDTDSTDVRIAAKLGLFTGFSPDKFEPDKKITRGQFAGILVRFMRLQNLEVNMGKIDGLNRYSDKNKISEEHLKALAYLSQIGILQGGDFMSKGSLETKFNIMSNTNIATQDAVTALGRLVEWNGWMKSKEIYYCGYQLPIRTKLKGDNISSVDRVSFLLPSNGNDERALEELMALLDKKYPGIEQSTKDLIFNVFHKESVFSKHSFLEAKEERNEIRIHKNCKIVISKSDIKIVIDTL